MPVRHVLVVDDSKSARLMLRKMLQGFGLTVDTVDSAEEALDYLRTQRPDAIFMDHTMPGLDGLTAVRQLKSEPMTAMIPITMYSSKDEPSYQGEAQQAGALGVLVKPATPGALGAALEKMNAVFDTVAARIAGSPSHPAPLQAPAAEGVSSEEIGKIALEKAELVVYDAIESQVLPLLNDVIAKLRREMESGQEEICGRVAAQIFEARSAQWQPPSLSLDDSHAAVEATVRAQLPPLLEERLKLFQQEGQAEIERQAKEVASQVCQHQLDELSDRLGRQLNSRLAEATQHAGEIAREAALQTAQETALQVIAETASNTNAVNQIATEQAFRQLWIVARKDIQRRIDLAAGWAAVIGIAAAVLTYVLR